MSSEAPTTLAARLARSRIGLNPDLEVSRHLVRGEASYVVRNPLTLQSHLLSAADYQLLTHIRADRSLGDTFEELVERGLLSTEREEDFYYFVLGLHRMGFLQLPISDEQQLYRRHVAGKRARRLQHMTSVFFLQVPLFNPDALLERTKAVGKVIFSRAFFALWALLVLLASFLAVRNSDDLWLPLQQLGAPQNLPLMFGVLLTLKLFHEFGHAYACKYFGGQVPEMGAYLIVFTPCAYVDTTAAWSFPRKRDRLLVCLAGMYVELFFAALGMIVWCATPPSTLNQLAFDVALLGSVVTVGLNINPLMRFDGYYALSDLVEIPNLRARAQAALSATFKRVVLGLRTKGSQGSAGLRLFLTSFGVAGGLYKVSLVLVLSAVIAKKYPAVGLLLAGFYVAMELYRLVRRGVHTFFLDPETAAVRHRAAAVGVFLLLLLPAGICFVPVPYQVVAPATVSAEQVEVVRAERPGFLNELLAQPPDRVQAGQGLLVLEDARVEEAILSARAERELAAIELRAARAEEPARVPELERRARQLDEQLATRLLERDKLSPRAPAAGPLVALSGQDERGRFVTAGEPLATVVAGPSVVHAVLTEQQVERARPAVGGRVDFRAASDPSRTIPGSIARIAPFGSDLLDEGTLASVGGGDIHVDPNGARAGQAHYVVTVRLDAEDSGDLLYGGSGRLRLYCPSAPVGKIVLRGVLNLRNRLAGRS